MPRDEPVDQGHLALQIEQVHGVPQGVWTDVWKDGGIRVCHTDLSKDGPIRHRYLRYNRSPFHTRTPKSHDARFHRPRGHRHRRRRRPGPRPCLALAARGAKVLVNDLGGTTTGTGGSPTAAQAVVDQIVAAGGQALANGASVTDPAAVAAMVQQAIDAWGRVDILVNNAGILRDKSFAKMSLEDFRAVVDVHLMGAVHCCQAVWPHMVAQKYGRIVMTTSSSGLYGNFGQANYGAAKMALVGLMQTLSIEGAKSDIRVNCLAPPPPPA